MFRALSLALLASVTLSTFAFAGPVTDAREGHRNTVERVDDRHDLSDDRIDSARLADIVGDWHEAWRAGNRMKEQAADARLDAWLAQELRESGHEVGEARREVAASRAEVRASRREVAHVGARHPIHDTRDDRRDLAGDKLDRADDRRDLAKESADLARTRAIADELRGLQPRFAAGTAGARLYAQKSALLNELKGLSAAELRRDHAEIREDRSERTEDRGERHEHGR